MGDWWRALAKALVLTGVLVGLSWAVAWGIVVSPIVTGIVLVGCLVFVVTLGFYNDAVRKRKKHGTGS